MINGLTRGNIHAAMMLLKTKLKRYTKIGQVILGSILLNAGTLMMEVEILKKNLYNGGKIINGVMLEDIFIPLTVGKR